jgi:hypothetical protein
MNTDDLIDALARDPKPAEPIRQSERATLALTLGVGGALLALLLTLGVRPDLMDKLPVVAAKAGFSAALASFAALLMMRLARPGRPTGGRAWMLAGALAISLLAAGALLASTDPAARIAAWTGGGFPWCLVIIPALATPIAAALIWLMRAMAPTRLDLAGSAIGALAGGLGAMVYALYCPVDSAAFVTTWYALAIALCAALGAMLGQRFLRW